MSPARRLQAAATRRWRRRAAALLVGLAVVIASCSSDDDSGPTTADTTVVGSTSPPPTSASGTAAQSTSPATDPATAPSTTAAPDELEPVAPLKITIGSRFEGYGAIWVALGEGLFEQHGVDVEVVSYNGIQTGLAQLVSNQIDLLLFSPFLGLQARQDGSDLVFIYNHADLSYRSSTFIARPDITAFDQLAALGSDCQIATTSIGTAPYYFATRYVDVYGLGCEIVPQASIDLQVPAIASGEVEAGSVLNAVGLAAAAEGLASILYDPRTVSEADGTALLPETYPILLTLGIRDVLESKRESVVRYVAALQEASEIIAASTPEELAEITLRVEPWVGIDPAALTIGWQLTQPQIPSGAAARIDPAAWERVVDGVRDWGIETIDPTNTALGFPAAVDMSYFDEALERG